VPVTLAVESPISVCTYRFNFVFVVFEEKIIRMVGSRRICSEEYSKTGEIRQTRVVKNFRTLRRRGSLGIDIH
jgi:hypothetical protein